MSVVSRLAARLLRAVGLKKAGWNISHGSGAWDRKVRSGELVDLVSELAAGGRIVEFGCGNGEMANLLPDRSFSSYLGTDISSTAIEACQAAHRKPNVEFAVADMATWNGEDAGIRLILCEECINYLSNKERERFLDIAMNSLEGDGHVLLTMHDRIKFADVVDHIRSRWNVINESQQGRRIFLVLDAGRNSAKG